jgi:putative hydrolase of the HAD superfamily
MNRGFLFDLDDTLLDRSASFQAFALAAAELVEPEGDAARIAARIVALDEGGYVGRERFFEALSREFKLSASAIREARGCFFEHVWHSPVVARGAREAMTAFAARGFRVGIVSNGSAEAQSAKLDHSGLGDLADVVVISGVIGVKKPDPTIYGAAIDALDIRPDRSWYVGDHPVNDAWGGKQVGFRIGWVQHERMWPEELAPCYDATGRSLADVVAAIEGIENDE